MSQNLEEINTCLSLDNCLCGLRKSFQLSFFEPGYNLPSPKPSSLLTRIKKKERERETLQCLIYCTIHPAFPYTQAKHTVQIHKTRALKNHIQRKKERQEERKRKKEREREKERERQTDSHSIVNRTNRNVPASEDPTNPPGHQCLPSQSGGHPSPSN